MAPYFDFLRRRALAQTPYGEPPAETMCRVDGGASWFPTLPLTPAPEVVAEPAATPPATPAPVVTTSPALRAPGLCRLDGADGSAKTVALTFDDGPNPETTPQILAILREEGVKATFFVNGNAARAYPELIRQIVAEGHELGNHTDTHPQLTGLEARAIRHQLSTTDDAVDAALGYDYPLWQMRPPYGANNQRVRDVVEQEESCMVLWNVDSNDWRYKSNDAAIMANVFAGDYSVYRRGGVILLHDVHAQTVRVTDDIIHRLKAEGFRFTTTGAMVEAKYPVPAPPPPSVR